MLCSEACLVNKGDRKERAITLYCKSWKCPICLPKRRNKLTRQAAAGMGTRFITLTTKVGRPEDADAEARKQGQAFRILIRYYRQQNPNEDIAFFVVREATKQGWPHLHIIMRGPFVKQRWLSKIWARLTGSFVVHIRKVDANRNAAKYLAKYIGKDPHRFGTTKRYWCSRNWFDVVPPRKRRDGTWDSKWHIVRERVGALAQELYLRGWRVDMGGTVSSFEARAPP